LDAAHERAREAFKRRDVEAYMETFSPTLRYQQLDGRVLSRPQLTRDVQTQLERMHDGTSESTREALELAAGGEGATELVRQSARYEVRAFFVLHRSWRLSRLARYHWARSGGRWQITSVQVLEEHMAAERTWLAFR